MSNRRIVLFWRLTAAAAALAAVTGSSRPAAEAPRADAASGAATEQRVDVVLRLHGHRGPETASVSSAAMRYLPFDVPAGVTRIVIHREYEHGPDPKAKNTVDFGLFDSRGGKGDLPTAAGFRGWQGGSPGDFVLTGDPAACSPHAVPGPVPAGRWHIAQYLLAAAPAGLTYTYTVTLSFAGPKPPAGDVAPAAYDPGVVRPGPDWYAGNLHCHSLHSDGGNTFADTIARCEAQGFDFVASTEHNATTAHYEFAKVGAAHPKTLLLFGDEFTSPGGHAGIVGQRPGFWFDFRMDPGDNRLPSVIDEAHRQGAVFIVNHPFADCTTCSWRYTPPEWIGRADGIEVWNGAWTPDDRLAADEWDALLRQGLHLVAYGGTDYHRGDEPMQPAALVHADALSTPGILDGLRKGRVLLSESPRGRRVELIPAASPAILPGDTLTVPAGQTTIPLAARVTGATGEMTLRVVWADGEASYPVPPSGGGDVRIPIAVPFPAGAARSYVRAELLKGADAAPRTAAMAAMTNPIYLARP